MILLKKKLLSLRQSLSKTSFAPVSLMLATGWIAFAYVLAEWVFLITKPSFLNNLPFYKQLLLQVNAAALLIFACLLILLPIFLYGRLVKKTLRPALLNLAALLPTSLLATLVLLLIDNFTYTVLQFGIISTRDAGRLIYTVLYLALMLLLYQPVLSFTRFVEEVRLARRGHLKMFIVISLGFLLVFGIILPLLINPATEKITTGAENSTDRSAFPNILLITADSLDAADMSLYGSDLDTTPFLKQLSGSSLLAENAFSNAQGTIGALTSLLSGKYPADVRVIYSTDILTGKNSYQHLPGVLNAYGYQTVQLSYSYYADAYTINMLGGFDEANGRKVTASGGFMELMDELFPSDFHVFLREVTDRASDRLAHIFFIKDMADPYKQATEGIIKISDQKKMERVLSLFEDAEKPVFIHLHWMGTHGPKFYPSVKVFSAAKDNLTQKNYDPDLYADVILEFDQAVKALYTRLEQNGMLDHTLLVVSSDHSQKWTNSRLPLLMHFPGGEHQQVITHNVQSLDVAPTLLQYLGITPPQWMAGESLLDGVALNRPIFTAEIPKSTKDKLTGKVTYPAAKAPFYQFGRMAVVLCDRWYELDLTTLNLIEGRVTGYAGDCEGESSTPQQALQLIAAHLEKYGFDISSLENVTLPK